MKDQTSKMYTVIDIPTCVYCKLSEQRSRCDVEKFKCGLIACRKCLDVPTNECKMCSKKMKQHRFNNTFKEKIRNDINHRFQAESKFRNKFKIEESKYSDIDSDLIHILAALLGQSKTSSAFNTYLKQLQKLVDQLFKIKNTVENKNDFLQKPILIKERINQNREQSNGKEACGYPNNDYSKGIYLINNYF